MFCEKCGKKLPEIKICPDCQVEEVAVPVKDKHVLKIFLMSLILIAGMLIIPGVIEGISLTVGVFKTGINPTNIDQLLTSKYMIVGMFITPFIITIFLLIYKRKELKEKIKDFFNSFGRYILYIVIGVAVMYSLNLVNGFIMNLLGEANTVSENQSMLEDIFINATGFYYVLYITDIAIFTPVFEEYFCRYIFKKHFKKGLWFILFTSVAFGLFHGIPTSLVSLINFIQYTLMGSILAFTYYKTDNILCSILIHIINNSIAVLFMI